MLKILQARLQQYMNHELSDVQGRGAGTLGVPLGGTRRVGGLLGKTSLNIWKFMVHILLKPSLENFEHYFTSV